VPNAIRIDDLFAPRLTDVQQQLVAWGETTEVDFSEAAILAAARERTGLSDFGPDDFRERLRILREEWGGDPELTRFQRAVLQPYLVRYGANRLLIQDELKRHPEILREEIREPVIVTGLPRSGTTHLVNLLGADERFHSGSPTSRCRTRGSPRRSMASTRATAAAPRPGRGCARPRRCSPRCTRCTPTTSTKSSS
jgi:hypothetical protein